MGEKNALVISFEHCEKETTGTANSAVREDGIRKSKMPDSL